MTAELDLTALRSRLEEELAVLEGTEGSRRAGAGTVELDQTRTGRLSRMDALQGQAMARATGARAEQRRLRILAALRRMNEGSYGDCVRCEEPIAPRRLQADPAVSLCIDCAARSERR